jgi:hypothetical protein
MTSKWRERLYSPSWSTGERVYVIVLWLIILGSLLLLGVLGVVLYDSLNTGAAAPGP